MPHREDLPRRWQRALQRMGNGLANAQPFLIALVAHVRRMQHVADGEIGGVGTAAELVCQRAAALRPLRQVALADQRIFPGEAAGEDQAVAGDALLLP